MADPRINRLIADNNRLFFGTVVASDAGTYTLQVAPSSTTLPGLLSGVCLSSALAGSLGIKESCLPQPGSIVLGLTVDSTSCVVLGTMPYSEGSGIQDCHLRSTIGAGDSNTCKNNVQGYERRHGLSKTFVANSNRPTDVVDGEYVLSNEFGVLLGLFQHFATLKASELAQIQAFVFDDLLRIVSHNFEHITCMGQTKIFQEGNRTSQEFNLTHSGKEASGLPDVIDGDTADPVITLDGKVTPDDTSDFFKLAQEQQLPIDRLKGFVGALGDFVHLIFSRPDPNKQRVQNGEQTAAPDLGLASLKLDMDGSVALRSVGSVALEKSNWIRVPQRIKPVEESKDVESPKAVPPYKFDSSVIAGRTPFLYFLQLRDYLAYTMEGLGYRRFANSDGFEVNNDRTKETAPTSDLPITPERTGNLNNSSAGVYIMPNGGIVLRDAWGSALVMEGGNIYIQPAKDMVMQPMRNLVGKVGHSVAVAARKDIDWSSTEGGMRIKTEQAQYLYSASSGILLHSDVSSPFEYYPQEQGTPITSVGGIVLHAPTAGIAIHGQHSLIRTDENSVIKSKVAMIDADSRILFRSNDGFDVFTTGDLILSAGKTVACITENTAVFAGMTSTIIGLQDQTIAVTPLGPAEGLFPKDNFQDWRDKVSTLATGDFQDYSFAYRDDTSFDALNFYFQKGEAYGLAEKVDAIPQTIAQQENANLQTATLKPWVEKPVNDTYPYPGTTGDNTYATAKLVNLEFDPTTNDLYNKAIEHSAIGAVEFSNLFTDYTVYA